MTSTPQQGAEHVGPQGVVAPVLGRHHGGPAERGADVEERREVPAVLAGRVLEHRRASRPLATVPAAGERVDRVTVHPVTMPGHASSWKNSIR